MNCGNIASLLQFMLTKFAYDYQVLISHIICFYKGTNLEI